MWFKLHASAGLCWCRGGKNSEHLPSRGSGFIETKVIAYELINPSSHSLSCLLDINVLETLGYQLSTEY